MYRACDSEGQERGGGQSQEKSQKVEDCRGEEDDDDDVEVLPTTPG